MNVIHIIDIFLLGPSRFDVFVRVVYARIDYGLVERLRCKISSNSNKCIKLSKTNRF